MLCFRYKRLLIPYMEGELQGRALERVEQHLAGCERCRAELEAIRTICSALREASCPAMEPAPDLWAKVNARIAAEPAPARRRALAPQALSAAAATVLVLAIGLTLFRSGPWVGDREAPSAPTAVEFAEKDIPSPRVAPEKPARPESAPESGGDAARVGIGSKVAGPTPASDRAKRSVAALPPPERGALAPRSPAPSKPFGHAVRTIDRDGDATRMRPARPTARPTDRLALGGARIAEGVGEEARPTPPAAPSVAISAVGRAPAHRDAMDGPVEAAACYYAERGSSVGTGAVDESVVDALNETEGVRTAALFTYP